MKSTAIAVLSLIVTFVGLSSFAQIPNGNGYQCSPETFPCDSPWYFVSQHTVNCCCDDNGDQVWHVCEILTWRMERSGSEWVGAICWRMMSKGPEGTEVCTPGPLYGNLQVPLSPAASCCTQGQ